MVMPRAQEGAVGQIGLAAVGPRLLEVVCLAPRGLDAAAACSASLVKLPQGPTLRAIVESLGAPHVEDLGLPAEHHRDDLCHAGQPPDRRGRDRHVVDGRDAGGAGALCQGVKIDGDHDGGRVAAVQGKSSGVDVFEEGREPGGELHRVGAAVVGVLALLVPVVATPAR